MLLELKRKKSTSDATMGELFIDGVKECLTLEDEKREVKVMHETRIPPGEYKIRLQVYGNMTKKYAQKFPQFHHGMLWLQNVPNFESIYIHIGNTDDDSSGCILVGNNFDEKNFKLIDSTNAYINLYKKVSAKLLQREEVIIKVVDEIS